MKSTLVKILMIAPALTTVIGLCSCEAIEGILANIPGFSTGSPMKYSEISPTNIRSAYR